MEKGSGSRLIGVDASRGLAAHGTDPKPLRVLHVTSVETSNYFLNNLVDHSDPRAVVFSAVTLAARGGFVEELERRGVRTQALGCAGRSAYPRALRRLRAVVREERVDLVHTHLFEPTLLGLLAAGSTGRPAVVTRHHSDAVYKIPSPLKRAGYLALERWINRRAAHLIAPSRMVRDILVEREGVPAAKVSVVPYGQSPGRFEEVTPGRVARTRAELGMNGRLSLVCVSRLIEQKGHRFLFEALAGLTRDGADLALYLVGAGPDRASLEDLARRWGLGDRVHFLGWRDDALAILGAADVVVHPSLEDALPSAVIEAVVLERPLVATDVSGVADVVGRSEHGLIVPQGDAGALREAIAETIADLDRARARARSGRTFVLSYMDAGRVARAYAECYRRVIRPGVGPR